MTDDEQPKEPTPRSEDPWLIINAMRQVELSERAQHLTPWMDLVAKRPPLERDALIEAGKEIWRYRVATVRERLDEQTKKKEQHPVSAPTVVTDELLAETISQPDKPSRTAYAVYYFAKPKDPPAVVDSLVVDDTTYCSPNIQSLGSKTVVLPTTVENFGSPALLHNAIVAYLGEFFYIPPEKRDFLHVVAAYVMAAWHADKFPVVSYLRALGDFETGKTTLIKLIGLLCPRAVFAGGAITPAVIYRLLDDIRGTLVLDEADFTQSDAWPEIVRIFNVGYQKDFPILRNERVGDTFQVVAFQCFGPKLLSTRGLFPDQALESRCLTYTTELVPDLPPHFPLAIPPEAYDRAAQLRNMLLWWRFTSYSSIRLDLRSRVDSVELRAQQVLQPLLVCTPDTTARAQIIAWARQRSHALRQERSESQEGRILHELEEQKQRARKDGFWMVSQVTEFLNVNTPERFQLGERSVGKKLSALGFQHVRGPNNTAAYAYDDELLQRLRIAYGLQPPRTPRTPFRLPGPTDPPSPLQSGGPS